MLFGICCLLTIHEQIIIQMLDRVISLLKTVLGYTKCVFVVAYEHFHSKERGLVSYFIVLIARLEQLHSL